MRTFTPKPADITRAWHVIDADGLVLGRLSTEVARLLRGKHRPYFAPHVDTGDFVIIVNADKIALSSDKADKKFADPKFLSTFKVGCKEFWEFHNERYNSVIEN